MALALQPRLALRRTVGTVPARLFSTTLPARDGTPFPRNPVTDRINTAPAKRGTSERLPFLPAHRREVDPLAKEVQKQRVPHPYDANTSSIADIIGSTRAKTFNSPNFGTDDVRVPVRSVPSTGRTVHVSGSVTPTRALQLLGFRCAGNKLPAISNRQRFHERPGLKRKRLRMSRWRARFKTGFHHTVTRMQSLARQGW